MAPGKPVGQLDRLGRLVGQRVWLPFLRAHRYMRTRQSLLDYPLAPLFQAMSNLPVLPDVALCVFAKPPRAGDAKTRLAPAVGAEGAAALARAFISDTWAMVAHLPWARPVLASTAPWPEGLLPAPVEVWQQGEGDLGARMERILHRGLELCPAVMALGADSPGLPVAHLEAARAALADADAVFGPSDDGGFYLLALRRLPVGALVGLPWSQPETLARTEAQLKSLGLTVARVAPFFDVDVPADLERLEAELGAGRLHAPATAKALATLRSPAR